MNITLTGASGFIGKRLIEVLGKEGHRVRALGRHPVEGLPFTHWDSLAGQPPAEGVASADAIIHLAGEPVAQRWTPEAKKRIRDSRVAGTRHLIHALSTESRRPAVLVAASAVGIYGSRGDEALTEKASPGEGFLAEVTEAWEHEADMAGALGIRVVKIRFGMVLGKGGGALEKMLPPFRFGVGGRLGSGKQWVPWVHLDDITGLIAFSMTNSKLSGAVNGTAPNPVRNAEFTEALAQVLHRPAVLTVPRFALKLLFGEMAEVLLASQRVVPEAAQQAGYRFSFPNLPTALFDILAR